MFTVRFSDGAEMTTCASYRQTAKLVKWYLQGIEEWADAVLYTGDGREVAYFRNYPLKENVLKRWDILEEEER